MRLADILQFDSKKSMIVRRVMGIPCVIEYAKGSTRLLRNDAGDVVYKVKMHGDYGFISGTKGRDGDEVDVLLGPMQHFKEVYVIHMRDLGKDVDQREDEDKVILGCPSAEAAKRLFFLHYPKTFLESMTVFPFAEFRKKLRMSQLPHRGKMLHANVASYL